MPPDYETQKEFFHVPKVEGNTLMDPLWNTYDSHDMCGDQTYAMKYY
jgi:hypothetical protein